jgi:hypothetical protein
MLLKIGRGFGLVALLTSIACFGACGGSDDGLAGPSGTAGSGGSGGDASAEDAGEDVTDDTSEDAHADVSTDPVVDVQEDVAPDVPAPCAAPSDPTKRALCIVPQPESIQLLSDPALDGNGIMLVQVYDVPVPDLADGGEVEPLAATVLPEQPPGTNPPLEMNIYDPISDLRYDDLPATVYVRILFFDNLAAMGANQPTPGIWIGGMNMVSGLFVESDLLQVSLLAGEGKSLSVPLTALRRLRLTMTLGTGATPLGDGQGPAGFILLPSQELGDGDGGDLPAYGYGVATCGNLPTAGGLAVEGVFVGAGPYFPLAFVDDFGKGLDNGPGPGTIIDLDGSSAPPVLPASSQIAIPAGAYSVDDAVVLNYVVGFPGAPEPDMVSCTPLADAGTD